MQIHWLSEKGRICAQGIVPRWAAVTAGMCRIPLICLGWEKISVVQTSPRPAASTLQALRIGKYLEGHLIKPLHSALFTPSPTYKHILHSFYTFKNLLDFFLLETHSASFDALAWLLHKLLACFPISYSHQPYSRAHTSGSVAVQLGPISWSSCLGWICLLRPHF